MRKKATRRFHDTSFDSETLLKLKIFRQYVREWLPVFVSKRTHSQVNIFDFFAGPGTDVSGNPGSPLIVVEEVSSYYARRPVDPAVSLTLYFSDENQKHTARLRERVTPMASDAKWQVCVDSLDFAEAFVKYLPSIRDRHSANLVILDQFGFRHMPPEVFVALASCETTVLICFMSSSYIRRFIGEPATQRYVPIPPDEMERVPASEIHRYVCDYYRSLVPAGVDYHVAPFSIKSQANVHGLIFGSRSLLGLNKFLDVCWGLDEFTGEANFAIDNDPIATRPEQPSLFDEYNVPKKQTEFAANLEAFLTQDRRTNKDVYRFTLESGFLPRQANALLRSLQTNDLLVVKGIDGSSVRRGSYYVSWDEYKTGSPRVVFTYKGSAK